LPSESIGFLFRMLYLKQLLCLQFALTVTGLIGVGKTIAGVTLWNVAPHVKLKHPAITSSVSMQSSTDGCTILKVYLNRFGIIIRSLGTCSYYPMTVDLYIYVNL
jgi:hypothetical protein